MPQRVIVIIQGIVIVQVAYSNNVKRHARSGYSTGTSVAGCLDNMYTVIYCNMFYPQTVRIIGKRIFIRCVTAVYDIDVVCSYQPFYCRYIRRATICNIRSRCGNRINLCIDESSGEYTTEKPVRITQRSEDGTVKIVGEMDPDRPVVDQLGELMQQKLASFYGYE